MRATCVSTWQCCADEFPDADWKRAAPAEVGLDETLLLQARDYALTGEGSGIVVRHGKLVMSWGDLIKQYDLKSTSKSIGVTALGLAIDDGRMQPGDFARQHHPKLGAPPDGNADTGWLGEITIQHLATQTAGFDKPGGYQPLLFRPGTKWHYSDCGPNWLAECVTLAYGKDVQELLFDRVFAPIGITRDDLRWRNNAYRDHNINGIPRREFGSGVHANVNAMARIGILYLHEGRWNDQQLLSPDFVRMATGTQPNVVGLPEHADEHGNASDNYGRYLDECIQSVLHQGRRPDEILIVDDASEDDTAEIAERWKSAGVQYLRVDHHNVRLSRQTGLAA